MTMEMGCAEIRWRAMPALRLLIGLIGLLVSWLIIERAVVYYKSIQRANTTKQIYAITYMLKKACHSSGYAESAQLDIAVNRFRNAYPEVMQLVDKSPYLPVSAKEFENFLDQKEVTNQTTKSDHDKIYFESCRLGIASLNDIANGAGTPSGNKMASHWISTLKP